MKLVAYSFTKSMPAVNPTTLGTSGPAVLVMACLTLIRYQRCMLRVHSLVSRSHKDTAFPSPILVFLRCLFYPLSRTEIIDGQRNDGPATIGGTKWGTEVEQARRTGGMLAGNGEVQIVKTRNQKRSSISGVRFSSTRDTSRRPRGRCGLR